MNPLSQDPNVDINTLRYLNDDDLKQFCSVKNKYIHRLCNKDSLWMLRILDHFRSLAPDTLESNEDILNYLVEEYNINIPNDNNFWRNLYFLLTDISNNLSELYIRTILSPDNREQNYEKIVKILNLRKEQHKKKNLDLDELNRQNMLGRPIVLKPQIRQLLNETVIPTMAGEQFNNFILYSRGITDINIVRPLLIFYLNLFGDVSDELFSILYDDLLGYVLEDVAVPEKELTQEEQNFLRDPIIPNRINQEFNVIRNNYMNRHHHRRYEHLQY